MMAFSVLVRLPLVGFIFLQKFMVQGNARQER